MSAPKPCLIQIYSLTYYPGSALYERVKKEMPEKIINEDVLTKDHMFYRNDIHNDFIRLAAYMNPRLVKKIIQLYKSKPKSFSFFVFYKISQLFCRVLFEPLNYFLTIKLSQRDSYIRTLKALPIYLREGIRRYFGQFATLQKKISYYSGSFQKKQIVNQCRR